MWYNLIMITEEIKKNDEGQRLDRYLKKAYKKASLSYIYKLIRKDLKVNGKREKEEYLLKEGDVLAFYISEEDRNSLMTDNNRKIETIKKQFQIVFENEEVLIVNKPFGLLTHGNGKEKKNTLANQVITYLIATGDYVPRNEKTFTPAPSNRLDRNTTGLVIFGKSARSCRLINEAIRERKNIRKFYLTIVKGELKEKTTFENWMIKDELKNKVSVFDLGEKMEGEGKRIITKVTPIASKNGYSLIEVEIPTGRSHQIRSQLQKNGFPLIGDSKYGDTLLNKKIEKEYKINTQLLHAYKLNFDKRLVDELKLDRAEQKCLPREIFFEVCEKMDLEIGKESY